MQTIRDEAVSAIRRALAALAKSADPGINAAEVPFVMSVPDVLAHGDYATNAALVATKLFQEAPMTLAERLAETLRKDETIKGTFGKIEVVKPGFVNLFVLPARLQKTVDDVLREKGNYGRSRVLAGQSVNVEFISANPTGPLTLANGRGGFWGDALGNLMAFAGAKVEKEYYLNDAGNQVKRLGASVLAAGGVIPAAEDHYQGDYIAAYAKELAGELAENATDPARLGARVAEAIFERSIKPPILRAGIHFDYFTSEARDVRAKGLVEKRLTELADAGYTYEKDGATFLKTTAHGDSEDRVLVRSGEPEPTYLAVDIAYHLHKWSRGATRLIDIWGADHHGAVVRLNAAMAMLGKPAVDVILMQFVRLVEDGVEAKMSKRAGTFVTLAELLDEVGVDAARFFFLMHQPNSHMDFDLALAKQTSRENPVFYAQYAHARTASVLAKAHARGDRNAKRDLNYLSGAEELALLKVLAQFPDVVSDAARTGEVHRLPQYATDLAGAFHRFYEAAPIVGDDRNVSLARTLLTEATQMVLKNVLGLMGVSAPEKM